MKIKIITKEHIPLNNQGLHLHQSVIHTLLYKILCFQRENLGDPINESIFLYDRVQILVLESWQILNVVIFLSPIDKVQIINNQLKQFLSSLKQLINTIFWSFFSLSQHNLRFSFFQTESCGLLKFQTVYKSKTDFQKIVKLKNVETLRMFFL